MDSGTRIFWGVVLLLASASTFFGFNAEQQRRTVRRGESDALLQSGDLVTLVQVLEADTLLVETSAQRSAPVRLVGIRAFVQGLDRAGNVNGIARQSRAAVKSLFNQGVAEVQLHPMAKDAYGRYLAHLTIGEVDLAEHLLELGLALFHAPLPFSQQDRYWEKQQTARATQQGLWSDPELVVRADRLLRRWAEENP